MIYGANYETWRKESETCGGCGAQSAELVLLGNGWDFKACPACVAECAAVEARERAEHGCTVAEVGAGEFKLIEPMQGALIPEAAAPMQRVRVSRIKEVA